MPEALKVTHAVQLVVCLGPAVVAIRTWRRQGGPAAWPAGTFAVLGLVVPAAVALPVHSDRALVTWARKVVVAGFLLFFPYCLYRFTAAFEPVRARWDRAAGALTVAVLLARRRMRPMATGSIVFDVALLVAAAALHGDHPRITLATPLLGFPSAGLCSALVRSAPAPVGAA